jgi:hypothetical protein
MILGNFQKKAFGVALLMLAFSIVIMVYAEQKSKKTAAFPPLVNQCPDFFDYTGTTCVDTNRKYGESIAYALDLSNPLYAETTATSACNKRKWAKERGVTWDGITNGTFTC